jgi:hypothetical protein
MSTRRHGRKFVGHWLGGKPAGVVQVEPAGTVECFLGAPGELAVGEDAVVVVVVAGSVDGKAPSAGGSAIAQSAQGKDLAVGEVAVDVGEAAAEADDDSVQRSTGGGRGR